MLLGSPTSIALARVATDGRGCHSAGLEPVGNRTVGVGRQCDLADGKAHLPGPERADSVADVARRHDEAGARPCRAAIADRRCRVVDRLREQAADVDAVGRGQPCARASRPVAKAALTNRWQSSKRAATAKVVTLSPQQVSCCSCRADTPPLGNRIATRVPGRRWNAAATAPPVSPEVATRIVRRRPSSGPLV